MTSSDRFICLDGMRGVAALSVVALHMTYKVGLVPIGAANLSVDMFFLLSGFVLERAYGEKLRRGMGVSRFMGLRLARLYPMYLVGVLLGTVAVYARGKDLLYTLIALPLMPDFMHKFLFPLDVPCWSLFFELVVNILFAAVGAATAGVWGMFAAGLVLLALYCPGHWHNIEFMDGGWKVETSICGLMRVLLEFPLGVLVYRLYARGRVVRTPALLIVLLFTLSLLFSGGPVMRLMTILLAYPALIYLGAWADIPASLGAGLSWLGGISYPLYILHFPMADITLRLFGPRVWPMIACAGLCTALSHVFARYFEPRARKFFAGVFSMNLLPLRVETLPVLLKTT